MKIFALIAIVIFSYSSIVAQNYFLNGNAIATGNDCYQLTDALNYQNGTVWYANQIDLTQSFDITFEMNLGNNDGGADGICFVMHTQGTSAIGQSGGGLGYLNFGTSIAVEFDTWQNGEYGDPSFDHLAIVKNGDINHNGVNNLAGPVQMDPFAANTEDGQTRTVRITWNPSTQIFQVYYNCVFRAQSTVDIINSVFGGQNLVYWGFTAATGGAVNVQTVCLTPNILNVGNEVEICQGGSTTLSVGAALNNTYSWSPATYLSDSTSSSPVASPPTSTTYTVSYTDLCGTQVAQSINVIVEPLTVNLSTPTTLTCSNPITTISSTSNFTGVNYNWLGPGITTASAASSIQLNAAGWYILQSNINNQCFDEDSVLIMSDQIAPELTLISAESELNCTVITSTLSAEPNLAGVNYTWSGFNISQNNGNSIIINGPGSFNCIALDPNNGCTSSSNISINQNIQAPQLNGPITDTLTCQAPTAILNNWVDLNPMMTTNYTWQIPPNQIYSTDLFPSVSAPGDLQLIAWNSDNTCSDTLSVTIYADESSQFNIESLLFNTILTQNNDNINECWNIFHNTLDEEELVFLIDVKNIFIYNRWGQLIASKNGTFQICEELKNLSNGTYYFIADLESKCGPLQKLEKVGFFYIQ